jgi:hypothetical protein
LKYLSNIFEAFLNKIGAVGDSGLDSKVSNSSTQDILSLQSELETAKYKHLSYKAFHSQCTIRSSWLSKNVKECISHPIKIYSWSRKGLENANARNRPK